MANEKPRVLALGLVAGIRVSLSDLLKDSELIVMPMAREMLLTEVNPKPALVLASPSSLFSSAEIGQALRMLYPHSVIFLCCAAREGFERRKFIENGFTDAFLLPIDTKTIRNSIQELFARITGGAIRSFRPVRLIDLAPNEVLDFETHLYLPTNHKYVKLSAAGESLDAARIEKLKQSKFQNVQVPSEQMPKFYEYSARRLRAYDSSQQSETEKREKLSNAVRDLVSGLFSEQSSSFESGQEMMKDCGEIVKAYLVQGGESEWYMRIQQVLASSADTYTHSANVSTLAALFSLGLGIGRPEDLALAGLLHDIGIADLPSELQTLDPEDMTGDQLKAYEAHVQSTVNLIKSRKIIVPEAVTKAILQHHEKYNGTGYPSALFGDRISKEAQILALADRFDDLTSLRPGKALMSPTEAVKKLRMDQVNDPSKIVYSPQLLKNLLALFPQ
jgi:HD-GYP domain-containing protein (c-di-GMP phosphodiesterase class II)